MTAALAHTLAAGEPTENGAVVAAIDHLVANYLEQPSLETLAKVAGMSPFHFQRVFKDRVGISPKRFAQYLTVEHAKSLLAERESVLGAALDVGLSGPSRLHDLFIACEAMTPGEYKAQGRDLVIHWGLHDLPLGRALIGTTDRGICWFSFVHPDGDARAVDLFKSQWALAKLIRDEARTAAIAEQAFNALMTGTGPRLRLLLKGTNFQIKVWQALLQIPIGGVVSYQDIATAVGKPTAGRAVGQAVGDNPVAFLIPCHRVIRKTGVIHGYRGGVHRKRALLAWEAGLTLDERDEGAAA